MHKFANPARFMRLSKIILPWVALLAAGLLAVGLYLSLFVAPADYQMGDAYRIIFVHVPSAYMAMFGYVLMALASIVGIIWKHPLADYTARATAPIGAAFTLLALITGSLWGKPMWGAYWVWQDARLTSVLILFFLYLGYLAVWQAIEDQARAARVAAIVAIVGLVNIPIIKFSVEWWSTLHQPASLMRLDGPSIHPDMLWPLIIMILAFNAYFVMVLIWRLQSLILKRRIRTLRLKLAAKVVD
ncbi:heme ABC transporter permease [Luteithermobacter gelatinilyticus]|uniref:heme ABC transporter permease n=1 Tax=Luteithermobacter gelatinilyticus TaxID=2582913 RepID=UPI00110679A3|nr:heme ABC transporter permease [Luteithermobacter gelatinilyticus]|tara:strand:- start:1690 stop:2421 length:732 start_codon:yes stop_codon:yes gene_type:complete